HATPPPTISTLSLHDALPIFVARALLRQHVDRRAARARIPIRVGVNRHEEIRTRLARDLAPFVQRDEIVAVAGQHRTDPGLALEDRKSTRLNSSHVKISYAVF